MWFKVDDNFAFHPKAISAGNQALGLWVRAGSWSAQQLTDGVVPLEICRSIADVRYAKRLVKSGLWHPCDDGYVFHQWQDRQPSRAAVEKRRADNAERLRRWREAQM